MKLIGKQHEKQAIRLVTGRQRDALEPAVRKLWSNQAQGNLINDEKFLSARSVGAYSPIGSEAATNVILDEALRLGKRVALPKTESDGIRFYEFSKTDELTAGRYGIKEPRASSPINHLDLIVVPGLAFDRAGHRLGYGKGYYDRYLKTAKAFTVGLGFSFQLVDVLPSDDHDMKLGALATEKGIIHF